MVRIVSATSQAISEASSLLEKGGLVAIPTETVYGLAADARSQEAVSRIFSAKGRPSFNPLITHVYDLAQAEDLAEFNQEARSLAEHFWPGPLTMILPRRAEARIAENVTAGLPSIAIRVPAHKTARALLKACGFPLAAPSANKSGSLSPTAPAHVAQSLGDAVDMILADGPCSGGLESTVVDCTQSPPVILRPGLLTAQDFQNALGYEIAYDLGDHDAPKSPGQLLKHYAPNIPVRLNAVDVKAGEALLAFGTVKFMGLEGGGHAKDLPEEKFRNLSEAGDLYEAAANLFSMLRALDIPQNKAIAVMSVPEHGIGIALNNRLRRAANT